MQEVNAYKRLTHGYADGWRYLDNDTFIAGIKLTPRRRTAEPDGHDTGGSYVQYGRAPSGVNIKELTAALRDTMGGTSCRHEYDCCGCPIYHVEVKHLGSRRLLVRTQVYYNY